MRKGCHLQSRETQNHCHHGFPSCHWEIFYDHKFSIPHFFERLFIGLNLSPLASQTLLLGLSFHDKPSLLIFNFSDYPFNLLLCLPGPHSCFLTISSPSSWKTKPKMHKHFRMMAIPIAIWSLWSFFLIHWKCNLLAKSSSPISSVILFGNINIHVDGPPSFLPVTPTIFSSPASQLPSANLHKDTSCPVSSFP